MARSKKVAQYTLEGHLVMVWNSASDVQSSMGLSQSGIVRACAGTLSQCGGFRWKYYCEENNEYIGDTQNEFLYGITCAGLDNLGKWRTIRSAARDLKVDSSLICKVVNGIRFHWKGVMFVWADSVDSAVVKCMNAATKRMHK